MTSTLAVGCRREPSAPIAIIGVGCRFPGGAGSPTAFWDLIREGRDAVGEVPPDRWLADVFYDPEPGKPARTYNRHGGFVPQIDHFDAQFFGISGREALTMDPQQRLLLEVAWEALEDAGWPAEQAAGSATGVFVGISTHDYGDLQCAPTERKAPSNPYLCTGSALSIAANRLSYFFDLHGPSFAVDTACSSSLAALHLACQSISRGESSGALVCGVNALLKPEMTFAFSQAAMMSPDGRCRSFDARANGYVRSEGAACVALKPLAQARRDRDRVYAVLLGSAVNQDGRTSGISFPNGLAQEAMLREAYAGCGVRPQDVQYVEAHGTGTSVGDPIEANALGAVLGRGRLPGQECVLGSVKSNIGHLEAASGVAGLVKTALALYHMQIPPTVHFQTPNPKIDFSGLRLRVAERLETWPPGPSGRRLAAVNSFGFGGTNAHVVLAEAPPAEERPPACEADRACLLPLSAQGESALSALAAAYAEELGKGAPVLLRDVGYTAGARRSHHPDRLAIVADRPEKAAEALRKYLRREHGPEAAAGRARAEAPVVFVFTGMGPQWQGMGRELLDEEPVFRAAVEECDRLFRAHADWSLLEELAEPAERSRLDDDRIAQIALFSLQVGLAALWRSWGVEPDAIIGHSTGEMAAAYVAGALTLEDAVRVAFQRSRLQHRLHGEGAMLAVGASAEQAETLLNGHDGRVSVAAVNGPRAITLSGDVAALAAIADGLARSETFFRFLHVNIPYHSAKLDPLRDELLASLEGLAPVRPARPLWSTVTGLPLEGPDLDAEYWWRNMRQPVQFGPAVRGLIEAGHALFLEIGPHPVLAAAVRECAAAAGREVTVLPSLRRREAERATLLGSLGRLYTLGHAIDWASLYPSGRLASLPTYPWQRRRYWQETETSRLLRTGLADWNEWGQVAPTVHPLLGRPLPTAHAEAGWQVELDLPREHAWIADHVIQGMILCPAAAYLEMALEAAARLLGPEGRCAEELEIHQPLPLTREEARPVQLLADRGQLTFTIHSRQADGSWTRHVSGKMSRAQPAAELPPADLEELRRRLPRELAGAELYQVYRKYGVEYGPLFQGIDRVWLGGVESLARVRVAPGLAGRLSHYHFHPAVLDACLQGFLATTFEATSGLFLPVGARRIRLHRDLREVDGAADRCFWSHTRLTSMGAREATLDVRIWDDAGRLLAEVDGLVSRQASAAGDDVQQHEIVWRLEPRPDQASAATASTLPGPAALLDAVRPDVDRLTRERDRPRYYREFPPAQQRLTLLYVIHTFRRLGWEFPAGERCTVEGLAGRLGIVPAHHRLTGQLLDELTAAGVLRRGDGFWEVVHSPDSGDPDEVWRDLFTRLPAYLAEWTLLWLCGARLAEVLRGEADMLEVLFAHGRASALEHLYESSPSLRVYNEMIQRLVLALLDRLPRERPLRILEIGGGTGGLTTWLLSVLPTQRTTYVFTDVSRRFTALAEERFADCPFLESRVLDIEQDPGLQGYAPHSFDLVLAGDVLHATADLRQSLRYVRRLLTPGGLAVLLELNVSFLPTLFGVFSGWWRFRDHDLRPSSPLLPGRRWCALMEEIGFTEAGFLTDVPSETGLPLHSVVVAQNPAEPSSLQAAPSGAPEEGWLIVGGEESAGVAARLAEALKSRGARVVVTVPKPAKEMGRVLADGRAGPGGWRGLVYLAAQDAPPAEPTLGDLAEAAPRSCLELAELTRAIQAATWDRPPRLWVVTAGVQPVAGARSLNLVHAPLWGLGRVIANETAHLRCSLLDLGPAPGNEEVESTAGELLADRAEDEIALRGAERYVCRLLPRQRAAPAPGPFALESDSPGNLDGLVLRSAPRRPPGPGQVEIEVHTTGLNFKDVAVAMNLLSEAGPQSGAPGGYKLGGECAGRISAVGPGVEGLQVGQDVIAMGEGCFASHLTTEARLIAPRPPLLSPEEAAGIPIVFLTAYHALHDLARLQAGERLLIHSAAGGIGLAALQLARRLGAEVFATAGSPEKRAMLRALGVRHVFNSRSLEFADAIRELNGGDGVDVVLNSLGGDFIPRSLDLLREGGRFVELGKRDLEQNSRLGLKPFAKQLAFFSLNLNRMAETRPAVLDRIRREVLALIERRELEVLPHRVFPVTRVREAFRTMLKARHTGKVMVSMREPGVVVLPPREVRAPVRADGTYLVVGGLGGFGLATARWLVQQGARRLVLLGRQGDSRPGARQGVESLRAAGAEVRVARANAADAAELAAVLADVRRTMPPLRGVIHAAMVLDDCGLAELDRERLERVFAPKVYGAWNLHALTREDPLEWFVLYSSVASVLGMPGQGNYAAANVFLDLLAHHRRLQGLPALTVNWGAVADAGYVAEHEEVARRMGQIGVEGAPAGRLLESLAWLLRLQATQVSVHRTNWARVRKVIPTIDRTPWLDAVRVAAGGQDDSASGAPRSLRDLLLALPPAQRHSRLQSFFREEVAKVLGTASADIDLETPVTRLGLDSLSAIELAGRFHKVLQADVPAMTFLSGITIAQLTGNLLKQLSPEGAVSGPPPAQGGPATEAKRPPAALV